MLFLIGLLTIVLVLDCVVLMFLVLIQLPKKEAGAGLAFGGAATDALFGAGSGTVLTKITKYTASLFFVLAVVLSVMQRHFHTSTTTGFSSMLTNAAVATPSPGMPAPAAPATAPSTAVPKTATPAATTAPQPTPQVEDTNLAIPLPAAPATPAPAKK